MSQSTVNEKWAHIAMLLDRSGSMSQMDTNELAGSATALIKDQMKDDTKVTATVANFDDEFEIVRRNEDASDLVITKEDIQPRGMTALAPALGRMINLVDTVVNEFGSTTGEVPGTVVFILLSDGEQTTDRLKNSLESDRPFEGPLGYQKVSELVKKQETENLWKFFMLGTNFDAIQAGPKLGFTPQTCMNYQHSTKGGSEALRTTSEAVQRYHCTPRVEDRSANFDGYTQEERDASMNPDENGDGLNEPSAGSKGMVPSFSHRQWDYTHWENYTKEQSELIHKMMSIVPDGSILLPGTRFEIRWGALATSTMMKTPPSTGMIQVNCDTGFTRVVKRN